MDKHKEDKNPIDYNKIIEALKRHNEKNPRTIDETLAMLNEHARRSAIKEEKRLEVLRAKNKQKEEDGGPKKESSNSNQKDGDDREL